MSLKFEKQNTVSDNNENNTHDFLNLHDNDNCYNQNNNTNANCNNDNKNNNNLEDGKDTAWMCQKCLKSNSSKHGNKCSCGFQNNFVKNDEKNSDVNPKQEKKYESYWKCNHCSELNNLRQTVLFVNNTQWRCVNMNIGCSGTYDPKTTQIEYYANDDYNNDNKDNNNKKNNNGFESNLMLESMIQIENENTNILGAISKDDNEYIIWECPCGFCNDLDWEECDFCKLLKPCFTLNIKITNIFPIKAFDDIHNWH